MKRSIAPLAGALALAAAFRHARLRGQGRHRRGRIRPSPRWTRTTPTTPCRRRSSSRSTRACSGSTRTMKIVPVLAESYEASKDGLVYTVKLKRGIKFHDGTDFNAEAVKVTFDRVTNPDNKLKRYILYKNIAKTEVVDPIHGALHAARTVLAFHQLAGAPVGRDHLAGRAAEVRQGHRAEPGGHRPVQVRRVEAERLHEGREVCRLLAQGLPEGGHDHLAPGGGQQHARRHDADRRGALHLPGAATSRPKCSRPSRTSS